MFWQFWNFAAKLDLITAHEKSGMKCCFHRSSLGFTATYVIRQLPVRRFHWEEAASSCFLWHTVESLCNFYDYLLYFVNLTVKWTGMETDVFDTCYIRKEARARACLSYHTPPPAAGERRITEGSNVRVLPRSHAVCPDHISTPTAARQQVGGNTFEKGGGLLFQLLSLRSVCSIIWTSHVI